MLANKRRKRKRSRRKNPGLGALALANRRRRYVKVRHVAANKRRRGRRNPARSGGGAPGFLSGNMIRMLGYGTLGALAPALVTDTLLPKVGLVLTGIPRRLAQLAVPTVVGMAGGRRFLGAGFMPFMVGSYAATGAGLVADLTGGLMLSGVGRYALPAPGMGRYERVAPQLAGR